MSKRKYTALGFVAFAMLIVSVCAATLIVVGGRGESAIEAWVGDQLKAVVDSNLKPELNFESVDYQAPRTVVLTGVRLTADDPDNQGQRVDIIRADRLRIELAELPKKGEPLRIKVIKIESGAVRLIETKDQGMVGFNDFVRKDKPKRNDAPPISDVLQITQVVLKDTAIEYDSREPGTEPMRFDGIDTVIDIDQSEAGVYGIALEIERQDVCDIKLDAKLSLDQFVLDIGKLEMDLEMTEAQHRYLPPQVQTVIKDHELTGDLMVRASGLLDFNDMLASTAKARLTLTDGFGRLGDYRLPIKSLTIDAAMAGRAVEIPSLTGEILGGRINAEGRFGLEGDLPATLNLGAEGLRLSQLLAVDEGEDGKDKALPIAGKVDLQVNAEAPLTDTLNQLSGKGQAALRDGRVARLPVISGLIEVFESPADALDPDKEGSDEMRVPFELRGNHAFINRAKVLGSWFAMEATGKLYFNQKIALNVNGGPHKKALDNIPVLGRTVDRLTSGALTYGIRGTFSEMTVRPDPIGGLFGAPGVDEEYKPKKKPGDENDAENNKTDDKPESKTDEEPAKTGTNEE